MRIASSIPKRLAALTTSLAIATVGLVVTVAPVAFADILPTPAPVEQRTEASVTADVLPTVQIDSGVVWTQEVVGNTVYAGGSFANARAAGAAPGTNLSPRSNILAYNITTGNLTSFNPVINGQVKTIKKSPDGSRIYVGGTFTKVNGQARFNLAAFSTATGELLTTFKSAVGGSYVNAIAVTDTTVYVGGLIGAGAGVTRKNFAAFNASNGALLGWAPTSDLQVDAMVMAPGNTKVIVGGRFSTINGVSQRGLAALDLATGDILPWVAPSIVINGWNTGQYAGKAGIFSLSTDGTSIFGTGWVYAIQTVGNLEGTFSADPATGSINWIEDCHGDTYGAFSTGAYVYTVSHKHDCVTSGGFPQGNPSPGNLRHAVAFTAAAKGTLSRSPSTGSTYKDWSGTPAPAMVNWFPDWVTGSATGQGQAGWTVTGNADYVVVGGEFPFVNGLRQQGLVRFARAGIAPGTEKPRLSGDRWAAPNGISLQPGTARIAIPANWDRDDLTLTYRLMREGKATPVAEQTVNSTYWNLPNIVFTESGLTPGSTYNYFVLAVDGNGNQSKSLTTPVLVTDTVASPYVQSVIDSGASTYWRLGESTGNVAYDWAGLNDGVVGSDVTRSSAGGIIGDPDTSTTFRGNSNSIVAAKTAAVGSNIFTTETWIKTTTNQGGKILGFGNASSGSSGSYDRHLYMQNNGRLVFGVYPGGVKTVASSSSYNDGVWHQVVTTLGPQGMALYVDGMMAASDASVTYGQDYSGYWRIGGDNLNGWLNQPSNSYFNGAIDEVSIYPTVLSRQQIRQHYTSAGYTLTVPPAPADAYGAAVYNGDPDFYWRFDDAVGSSTAADSSALSTVGNVQAGVTFGQAGALQSGTNKSAQFNGSGGLVVSSKLISNPTTYSESLWFKTSSTSGGKLIGFGDAASGLSSNYDRHVYMQDDGKIVFGTWTGATNTITTTSAYNNGQWHQVTATQGSDGMKLYVDGSLMGTNGQTAAQSYSGYWRVGGDPTWGSSSPWFTGSIDEVAVYSRVLDANEISASYAAGSGSHPAPVAAFTSTITGLSAVFDSSTSTSTSPTTLSYAWDFGDSTTSTEAAPVHKFAAPGVYTVALTVTDSDNLVSIPQVQQVTATHAVPAPVITASITQLALSVSGSTTTTSDEATITNYDWNWGDGTPNGAGAADNHAYGVVGDYTVTLTVTDSFGSTASAQQSISATQHAAPVAVIGSQVTGLSATFNATGSTTSDGATLTGYLWDFGDGTSSTEAAPVHSYASAGTYNVKLVVTDSANAASAETTSAVVITHAVPVASFIPAMNQLNVSVNAGASTASDGAMIVSYEWNWGDDTPNGNGVNAIHTYAAGNYAITLTVTDGLGATGTSTQQVTAGVTAETVIAADAFDRVQATNWGTAPTGGNWSNSSGFSVADGFGKQTASGAGQTRRSYLTGTSALDVNATVEFSLDKVANGGGMHFNYIVRHTDSGEYRLKIRIAASGVINVSLAKVVGTTETLISNKVLAGVTYSPGLVLKLRFQVAGSGTTVMNGKVWVGSNPEPSGWLLSANDNTAELQAPGQIGVSSYATGSVTNVPVVVSIDNVKVVNP